MWQAIRDDLKAQGWNSRAISVRIDRYSMGATIHVTIKREGIRLSAVEAIANQYQDHGCIFISVSYDDSVWEPLADKIQARFDADGKTVKLGGCFVWQDERDERWYCIDTNQDRIDSLTPAGLARTMAKAVLNGGLTDLCLNKATNAQIEFLTHIGAV